MIVKGTKDFIAYLLREYRLKAALSHLYVGASFLIYVYAAYVETALVDHPKQAAA
jgi:uncharacterized protein YpiB (UPF0302 family)